MTTFGQMSQRDRLPLIGRLLPSPAAAKVPEVVALFWVVKVLTTAGGEATSDYLKVYGNVKGGAIEVALFVVGLVWQLTTRRYAAFPYWFFAYAIAVIGTGVADFLHLDVGLSYAADSLLWAAILVAIFAAWYRSEGTLSIHSIATQRREGYYWGTVFATFALGTALGDYTAMSLNLGYLSSAILFTVVIVLPWIAHRRFGLNGIAAFWMSYVVTRPLGASYADYVSKPRHTSGIGFGDGQTALLLGLAMVAAVLYLAVTRADVQRTTDAATPERDTRSERPFAPMGQPEPELD